MGGMLFPSLYPSALPARAFPRLWSDIQIISTQRMTFDAKRAISLMTQQRTTNLGPIELGSSYFGARQTASISITATHQIVLDQWVASWTVGLQRLIRRFLWKQCRFYASVFPALINLASLTGPPPCVVTISILRCELMATLAVSFQSVRNSSLVMRRPPSSIDATLFASASVRADDSVFLSECMTTLAMCCLSIPRCNSFASQRIYTPRDRSQMSRIDTSAVQTCGAPRAAFAAVVAFMVYLEMSWLTAFRSQRADQALVYVAVHRHRYPRFARFERYGDRCIAVLADMSGPIPAPVSLSLHVDPKLRWQPYITEFARHAINPITPACGR